MIRTLLRLLAGFSILSALAPAGHATAVGKIDLREMKYLIHAHLIYYGPEATHEIARRSTDEIQRMWNRPKIVYVHGGYHYPVEFRVTYDLYRENPINSVYGAINNFFNVGLGPHGYPWYFSRSYLKEHPELNLVSVQRFDKKNNNRSNYSCGGQTGIFIVTDNLGTSTTTAHEFGHGLGLPHLGGTHCTGSRPSIMCMRGSTTDPIYQYDPKVKPGAAGGTINPVYRVVRASDVLMLKLHRVPKRADGSQVIGPQMKEDCASVK